MTLKMKNGCARFLQIEELNTRANLCEKCFLVSIHKNNNEAVAMKTFCADPTEPTNTYIFLKGNID